MCRSDRCGVVTAVLERFEHRPAQQFLEERGGDAVGALDYLLSLRLREAEPQRATVELQQSPARFGVRERDLDGNVNPAWPGGESRLQQIGAVGGQQEEQVGVACGAVHRIEQVEEHRASTGTAGALLGDQVDILEHEHRGLQSRAISAAAPTARSARPVRTKRVYSAIWPTR